MNEFELESLLAKVNRPHVYASLSIVSGMGWQTRNLIMVFQWDIALLPVSLLVSMQRSVGEQSEPFCL